MSAPRIEPQQIAGVVVKSLTVHADSRGRFLETYRQEWFPGRPHMVQGNRSDSAANVLRGLHYHLRQADYWYVPQGRLFVALADLRRGSATRGAISTFFIGGGDELGVYIPPGVAHGYYAPEAATMTYLVDQTYDPQDELGVTWDDPELDIPWPLVAETPILSPRDQKNPRVSQLDPGRLPP